MTAADETQRARSANRPTLAHGSRPQACQITPAQFLKIATSAAVSTTAIASLFVLSRMQSSSERDRRMWLFPNSVKFEVFGITSWVSQRSRKALQASMNMLCDPLWNSQRGITSPHLRRLVSDRDHSGLSDEEAPDRAFAEKPELR